MNTSASTKLERYLNAFKQRLKRLTIVQGSAVIAMVLLSVSTLGAWFAIVSGYATDTIIIFRILLILALAAAFIKFISLPLGQLRQNISEALESRTANLDGKGFEGRIETYLQMAETGNPFRELLAENALNVSANYQKESQITRKEFSIAGSLIAISLGVLIYLLIAGPGMMNYSLRHLLAGWAVNDLLPPQSIVVTPGDQSVRRGANVRVTTNMTGFNPDEATIHVQSAANDWQEVSMVEGPNGFEFTFFSLQEPMSYYVSTTGLRSPEFDIKVVDLPSIESLSLTYTYPQWSERDPEIFTQGDIRTLPDTQVALTITTSAPLPEGELILNNTSQSLLLNDNQASTEFTVTEAGDYYIAAIVGGEQVRLSDDYFIRLTEDAKPVLEFSHPGEDYNASNIEEVLVRLEASDDYGLNNLNLKYAINGGDWQTVDLADDARNISTEYLFMLEDSPLVPGDLISYYAEVSDRSQTVRTDMFFIQIQPFNRRYTQSQLSGGGGGGGGGGQQDEISQRQRQIIVSTWNLLREQAEDSGNNQIELNATLLADLQETLAEQAQTLTERTRARQLNQDDEIANFVESMELAVAAMHPASEKLAFFELEDAIQPAQEALRHLLHAESVFNDITVSQQQGGGGGGGGASQDLAEMFELEMDIEKNQYETGNTASPQAQQQETEDIMSQLDELARRQEQLANNMAQQQQITEAQRYQQEMLRREAQQLQEQLQRRQERSQADQQGQQQANNQSSQQSSSEQSPSQGQQQGGQQGGQGQTGQGAQQGEIAQQSELQRRLESAIRAMDDANAAMNGNASQQQRQNATAEAQRQLEGARSQVAQEQMDSMQESFSNMADQAQRMLRLQQRMDERLQRAMVTAVEERESGEDPDSRGMGLQEEWSLARQKQNMVADLQNLQQQMLNGIQNFDEQAPDATRELQKANIELSESELEQALADAALYIDSGYGLYIAGNESNVTAAMRNLSDSLAEAQEMAAGAATPGDSPLDRAQRQAQDLRAQLQQQAQNQQGSGQEEGSSQQAGQANQATQGQQSGQSGGQSGGARFGSAGGAWASGDDLRNGPIELPTGFFDNIDNLSQLARAALPQLDLNTEELGQMMDLIRELEYSRINRNDAIITQEYNAMLALIEQLEVSLRADTGNNNPNNVRSAVADIIPEEYQDSVAEYYRRLSRE